MLSLSLFRTSPAELVPKEECQNCQAMLAASLEEREEEPARLHVFTLGYVIIMRVALSLKFVQ